MTKAKFTIPIFFLILAGVVIGILLALVFLWWTIQAQQSRRLSSSSPSSFQVSLLQGCLGTGLSQYRTINPISHITSQSPASLFSVRDEEGRGEIAFQAPRKGGT